MRAFVAVMILIGLLSVTADILADERQKSYDDAYQRARASGKRLMIIFSTERCYPCSQLESALVTDPQMRYIAGTYVVLKYKVTPTTKLPGKVKQIIEDKNIGRFPTTISIDPESGKYVDKLVGYDASKWRKTFAY